MIRRSFNSRFRDPILQAQQKLLTRAQQYHQSQGQPFDPVKHRKWLACLKQWSRINDTLQKLQA